MKLISFSGYLFRGVGTQRSKASASAARKSSVLASKWPVFAVCEKHWSSMCWCNSYPCSFLHPLFDWCRDLKFNIPIRQLKTSLFRRHHPRSVHTAETPQLDWSASTRATTTWSWSASLSQGCMGKLNTRSLVACAIGVAEDGLLHSAIERKAGWLESSVG